MVTRRGSEILVDELALTGAELMYHAPGESFLLALDALSLLHLSIRLVSCSHENGSAQIAEAYGKLAGRPPGMALVTRGPGATNTVNAVHTAYQDSSPMIPVVRQVKREAMER